MRFLQLECIATTPKDIMEDQQGKRGSTSTGIKTSMPQEEERKAVIPQYPLIRFADLKGTDTMQQDVVDLMAASTERHFADTVAACREIKEKMDKDYNPNWHVVAGESFAFDVTYEPKSLIYIFNGNLAVVAWKCN